MKETEEILMKETEVMKDLCEVPLEMFSIKKSILDQLSASNATWMHLNLKHDCITVFSVRPLRNCSFFQYVSSVSPFE